MENKKDREEGQQEEGGRSLTLKGEDGLWLDKGHEVIFRFSAGKREHISSLLKEAHFHDVRITEIEGGQLLLAYCRYVGDIKELDKRFQGLKSRALLTIDEERDSGLFDFFMHFGDITPSMVLNQPEPKRNQRRYFFIFLSVFLFIGILFGWKTLFPRLVSKVETNAKDYVRLEKPPITYPQWNRVIFPKFQPVWLKIKRDFNLEDREMIELFKLIKDIPRYKTSAGQRLNDLTIYPEIIDRALGLIVLKNVKDVEELKKLFRDLELRLAYSQSFPDEEVGKYVNMLDGRQFGNLVILAFYGDVLLAHEDFTNRLITKIRGAMGN
ncbi:MAG: hypothetical protein HY739_01855 [Desulfobacterales bacterium]|nr:hypothetical protein [Desulfobacterales bacterium]